MKCETFVEIEFLIISALIGFSQESFGYGIGIFIILNVLNQIPFINGIISIALSLIEAFFVSNILSEAHLISDNLNCFVSFFVFCIFIEIHRQVSAISDDRILGYSFIISEYLFYSAFLHHLTDSIPLAITVFAILLIITFVPIIRTVELMALTVFTSIEFYFVVSDSLKNLEKKYAVIASIIVFFYAAYQHFSAHSLLDYKSIYSERKIAKQKAEYEENNSDFFQEQQQQEHTQETDNIIYFAGVTDADTLKKRYRDLLKIYHPDNQNGDTLTVQQIQKEYDSLKAKYNLD